MEELLKKAGFTPSLKSVGAMYILGCKMWEHEKEGYYLTDYDITNDTSLKEKNLLMLFYSLNGFYVTTLITHELITQTVDNLLFEMFQDRVNRSIATL